MPDANWEFLLIWHNWAIKMVLLNEQVKTIKIVIFHFERSTTLDFCVTISINDQVESSHYINRQWDDGTYILLLCNRYRWCSHRPHDRRWTDAQEVELGDRGCLRINLENEDLKVLINAFNIRPICWNNSFLNRWSIAILRFRSVDNWSTL